jgi:hypothetical protein
VDEWAEDLTVSGCSRVMFETLVESLIEKLQLVISTHSVDDVFHSLLHCNDDGETPLEFVVKKTRTNGMCVEELVEFLQRWQQPLF